MGPVGIEICLFIIVIYLFIIMHAKHKTAYFLREQWVEAKYLKIRGRDKLALCRLVQYITLGPW